MQEYTFLKKTEALHLNKNLKYLSLKLLHNFVFFVCVGLILGHLIVLGVNATVKNKNDYQFSSEYLDGRYFAYINYCNLQNKSLKDEIFKKVESKGEKFKLGFFDEFFVFNSFTQYNQFNCYKNI